MPRLARLLRQTDEPAANELLQRRLTINRRQAGDPLTAPGYDHLRAVLNPLEILAEAVVQIANADFLLPRM